MDKLVELRKQQIDGNKHVQDFLNRKSPSLEELYRLLYKEEDYTLKESYKKLYKTIS